MALTAGDDRADIAFQGLTALKNQIAAAIGDKQVIIKPNFVSTTRQLAATHASNLEGILEFLKSIGKTDVIIAESAANGPASVGYDNFGFVKVAKKYGVKLKDLDQEGYEILQCIDEKDFRPHAVRISKMLLDPNRFLISAAKFKTHDLVVATLSLKNIVVGAPIKQDRKNDKPIVHGGGSHGINYNLYALAARLHPHLAVIDGYEGMEGNGPVGGTPVDHRICVASLDWLAADRVAVELMGIDFANIGYLNYCAQAGMGQADLSRIEILGPPLKEHVKKYQLAKNIERQLGWMQPVIKG